ncbi:putative cupredoxin [Rosa chinensis]|uniref:Putative cupredoxin n=1 Tax=Rosa chinensis TaxID=74649 RepID=A0A2P6PY90_ROSCH|nr:early nodulin-like protein 1 [Rosa chinensis]PRQ26882.1 putative cupredoxin [Rosa chinensis]
MAGFSSRAASMLVVFLVLLSFSEAREFLVGGKADAWAVPSSESQSLNKWAESKRFNTGDILVWKYDSAKDSVLHVTKEDYVNCNMSSPIKQYKDGETKIVLDRPGPFYFISGTKDHCEKGQKLVVVVMSPRNRASTISPAPSPAVEIDGPAVAPAPTSTASPFKAAGVLVVALMGFSAALLI